MKKRTTFKREDLHKTVIKNTVNLTYYAISIIDMTNVIDEDIVDDLFVAYQNGFLEVYLDEFQRKHRNLNFQIEYNGINNANVIFTKRPFWKKK